MGLDLLVYLIGILLVVLIVIYLNPLDFGKDSEKSGKDEKDKDNGVGGGNTGIGQGAGGGNTGIGQGVGSGETKNCEGTCDIDCPAERIRVRLTNTGAQAVCSAQSARVIPSPISARFFKMVNHNVGEGDLSKDCYAKQSPATPESWRASKFSDNFKSKYPMDGMFIANNIYDYLDAGGRDYLNRSEDHPLYDKDLSNFACGKTGDDDDCKDYFVPVLNEDGSKVIDYVNSEGVTAIQRIADLFYDPLLEKINDVYDIWTSDEWRDKDADREEIIKFDENSRLYFNQKYINNYPPEMIDVCDNYVTLDDFSVAYILGTLAVQSRLFGINGKKVNKEQFIDMYKNLFFIDYKHNAERGCKHETVTCMDGTTHQSYEEQMLAKMDDCQELSVPVDYRPSDYVVPGWITQMGIQTPDLCMLALNPEDYKTNRAAGIF